MTFAVAGIDQGGVHGARFPVHFCSALANIIDVSGPRSPGPEIGEQFRHRGPKSCSVMGPLLVADNVHELDVLGILRHEVAPLR